MSHVHLVFLKSFARFFNSRCHNFSTVIGTILQQSRQPLFFFGADFWTMLKNCAMYQEYDTRSHKCIIELLKLQEKLPCKLQQQQIVASENGVGDVAIVYICSIHYLQKKKYSSFYGGCKNWRNQRLLVMKVNCLQCCLCHGQYQKMF